MSIICNENQLQRITIPPIRRQPKTFTGVKTKQNKHRKFQLTSTTEISLKFFPVITAPGSIHCTNDFPKDGAVLKGGGKQSWSDPVAVPGAWVCSV